MIDSFQVSKCRINSYLNSFRSAFPAARPAALLPTLFAIFLGLPLDTAETSPSNLAMV
jgi:hypothetical protein